MPPPVRAPEFIPDGLPGDQETLTQPPIRADLEAIAGEDAPIERGNHETNSFVRQLIRLILDRVRLR